MTYFNRFDSPSSNPRRFGHWRRLVVALGAAAMAVAPMPMTWAETETAQVNSVSQPPAASFSDLSPDHWAYQAVQSLFANYGCLAGYPDGTFRGDQAVTRYEFAAGLNACLDAVSGLVQERQAANQAEVDRLIQSMQEFHNELNQVEERVGP
ncbi:MAG TPA: iron uptake porin [Trichocoleus sp.]